MSGENDDYSESGSDDENDPLVLGYNCMHNMCDESPFQGYDIDFDAYDANDSNLDVAVLTWHTALNTNGLTQRSEDARLSAINVAFATMVEAYSSTLRTQRNKRRRSD